MTPISGKVTASTVAASATTLVFSILAPHVFPHGVPSDIQGLAETTITAGITFVSGYLARHGIVQAVEREAEKVATPAVVKAVEAAAAPVLAPVPPVGG
jgi:hypothetical protein